MRGVIPFVCYPEKSPHALKKEFMRVLVAKARFQRNKITPPDLETGLLRCIAKNVKANIISTLAAVKQIGH